MNVRYKTINISAVPLESQNYIKVIKLCRAESSNAFDQTMIDELVTVFKEPLNDEQNVCRAVILCSQGKHFSAGADVEYMRSSKNLSEAQNITSAVTLRSMFAALAEIKVPVVTVVQGAAFGGALGLLACSDICIALNDAKFCFGEVKLGIIPAVILPFVAMRMNLGFMRRFMVSGKVFTVEEAKLSGLVDIVAKDQKDLDAILLEELNILLQASSEAQADFKKLFNHWWHGEQKFERESVEAIAKVRASDYAQEGLAAFLEKRKPRWSRHLREVMKL